MIDLSSSTIYRLENLNKEQIRISYQQSTGKKIDRGSDDTQTFAREIYVQDKITVYEGIKTQIEKTNAQNSNSDSTLKEIKKLLEYVKAETIKALNDTTDADARDTIGVQIEGVKKNILALGNERIEGEYLFAGSDTTVKPFVQDASTGKVSYEGNGYLREVAVEFDSYRDKGVNGFDMMAFSTSTIIDDASAATYPTSALLTFTQGEHRVVDQDGSEWKFTDWDNADGDNDASTGIDMDRLYKFDFNGKTEEYFAMSTTANPNEYVSTTTVGTVNLDSGGTKTLTNPSFETKKSIFDVLDNVIDGLKTNDREKMEKGLDEVTEAYDGINKAHADLGARNKVFELSYERVNSKLTQFNIFYQEVATADVAKVAIEAKALELTYVSLYSTINRLNSLSLVNYLN